jgi:hypothetical protein
MSFEIRVSARIIKWPAICPCCSAPSDTNVEISHVRVRGVNDVRKDQRSWSISYCRSCLDHIEAFAALHSFRSKTKNSAIFILCGGVVLVVVAFALGTMRSMPIAIILAALAAAISSTVLALSYSTCAA